MTAAAPGPVPDAVGDLVCSARGCRAEARWGVLWNNPKIHTPDRRKVWLACDDHREHLEHYLTVRDFLRGVVPVDELERLPDDELEDEQGRA
jgi:hypothetical protein